MALGILFTNYKYQKMTIRYLIEKLHVVKRIEFNKSKIRVQNINFLFSVYLHVLPNDRVPFLCRCLSSAYIKLPTHYLILPFITQ